MTKDRLIEIISDLLKADIRLDFLGRLKTEDLETLVACIRGRLDQMGNGE